jgi:protease-4
MSARRGVLVFVLLMVALGTAAVFAALALRRPSVRVADASVLLFDVPRDLEEGGPPPGRYSVDWLRPSRPQLWRVVLGLRHAARDDRIEALVLRIDGIDWGWAKVADVREAVEAFRASGKPVYAALSGGGDREYLLASAADVIASPPLAMLQLDGLSASALFLRGTLDKLEIRPNFAQSGAYKSGIESYTRDRMSPEAREALEGLVGDLYASLVDSLAAGRGLARDSVVALLDQGPYDAFTAYAKGLIDTVLHESEIDSLALGAGEERELVPLTDYLEQVRRPPTRARLALVVASGVIAPGRSRDAPGEGVILGSETMVKALREARRRKAVRAIILRVDSPGGDAPASDEIWREVDRCREEKPVVASMSDYAASGGYYIAVAADSIVAQSATVTGSIGVYGGKFNVLGLYRKLGLNVETVSRGRHAEMFSPFKDFSREEAARFQQTMDLVYRTFVQRVAKGRRLDLDRVEKVAQGRVWSGASASGLALVDELGGLARAIELAKDMAGIPREDLIALEVYPRDERNFLQRLFAELFSDEEEGQVLRRLPGVREWLAVLELPADGVLALLPFRLEIR